MTSTSSIASPSSFDIPSTSAENEIEEVKENIKKIQNPTPKKVNQSQDPNKKKPSTFSQLEEPFEENKTKILEEEAKLKKVISSLIHADLISIKNALEFFTEKRLVFEAASKKFNELKEVADAADLIELKNVVKSLKLQILPQDHMNNPKREEEYLAYKLKEISNPYTREAEAIKQRIMPNLFTDSDFGITLQFKDFKAQYDELPMELKQCLLCFSAFPEDVDINRRVMVYWWIGEGFVPPRNIRPEESKFTPEQWGYFYFSTLLEMGFITSAHKKPNPKADICKMHPLVRTMLSIIAQEAKFLEFGSSGFVNGEFSTSLRACLLDGKELPEDKKLLEKTHVIFNVDKTMIDFTRDSLLKMRNVKVLHLGRWQNLGTHHIEVDDTKILNVKSGEILDGLQNMSYLRLLSFQGISRITDLPKSLLKLKNLTILDIRACHNLERIPDGIGCLVNLTHLDMSECFLLDEMPKGISLLTKLEVLSGFRILGSATGNSCTLHDMKGFDHLRRLSINTNLEEFPSANDLQALNQFKALSKLAIEWGGAGRFEPRIFRDFNKLTTLVREVSDSGYQDDVESDLVKEQTPRKEIQEKSTKEANKKIQDNNDQISKKGGYKEGEMKAKAVMKTGGGIEMSQESNKHDKGKGFSKGMTRDIGTVPIMVINEASTSRQEVEFPPGVMEKDNEKNKVISVAKESQSSKQKQDLEIRSKLKLLPKKGFLKGLLHRGIKSLPTIRRLFQPILPELPSYLTKLDLQCLPEEPLPWLTPGKFPNLKKLYIRGGMLDDLGQFQDPYNSFGKRKWRNVEELRLKYLRELEMEWRELLELFPKLDYLEKVRCPKLCFFPCDETGIWTKKRIV